jgi:hypothetical protein
MDSSVEDARKKRDCAQVEQQEEKSKKVRVYDPSSRNLSPTRRLVVARGETTATTTTAETTTATRTAHSPREARAMETSSNSSSTTKVWDLESALLYLVVVQVDANASKEYLTTNEDGQSHWVTFRVGHAGDASTIAQWYRQSQHTESPELEISKQQEEAVPEESSSSSMLEVWLADGMGDEDTPPSVHCLLAQVHSTNAMDDDNGDNNGDDNDDKVVTTSLGGVVLLTLAWAEGERILRVEWMQVDPSLPQEVATVLEQRIWLRLSSLAWMTACQVLTVDEQLTSDDGTAQETSKRLPPSAE